MNPTIVLLDEVNMPNRSKDKDFELSKIEKVIRFLSGLILIGSFLLTLFFQQGRNILLLAYPVGYYWLIYMKEIRQYEELINPIRSAFGIFCLLSILNSFLFTLFELILNIHFAKVNNTWNSMNHPIANWIMQSNLIIFLYHSLLFPLRQ
jgi:hypothetical protein